MTITTDRDPAKPGNQIPGARRFPGKWYVPVLLALVIGVATLAPAGAQEIWLGPKQPSGRQPGAADWRELFQPDAAWPVAASHTKAFIFTTNYILITPDDELVKQANELARRNIGIAMPLMSIARLDNETCGTMEGYSDPPEPDAAAAKLHKLNIPLAYIRPDAPVWFGHEAPDATACHLSIPEVARRVARNLREYVKFFPDVAIGDVEPIPSFTSIPHWREDFTEYQAEFQKAVGKPLAFLHLDIQWGTGIWRERIPELASFARSAGLKFGIIYNGGGGDGTDEAWLSSARSHFNEIEGRMGIVPDQAVFQTWDRFPTRALPETSPMAQTHLITEYILPRARVMLSPAGKGVTGQLLDAGNQPIAGATLQVESAGGDLSRPPPLRMVTGTVPANAHQALIGLRVNQECNCSGDNDFLLGDIVYKETQGGSVTQTVSMVSKAGQVHPNARSASLAVKQAGGKPAVRITAKPDQSLLLNLDAFNVTPNATFQLQAPMESFTPKGMFGYVTVIWLDASGKGVARTYLRLDDGYVKAASATTDASGHFNVTRPGGPASPIRVVFPGTSKMRAAAAETP